jgi:hypothetical protein
MRKNEGYTMDLNVQAFRLVQAAVADPSTPKVESRDAARRGGIKGGRARAESLSSERRTEIARKANAARWGRKTTLDTKG